jgi:hypothetical protein
MTQAVAAAEADRDRTRQASWTRDAPWRRCSCSVLVAIGGEDTDDGVEAGAAGRRAVRRGRTARSTTLPLPLPAAAAAEALAMRDGEMLSDGMHIIL